MNTRLGSTGREGIPRKAGAASVPASSPKAQVINKNKDKTEKELEASDKKDKPGKQAKIDEMMASKVSSEKTSNDTEPDLRAIMDIVMGLDKKVNDLASKDYKEKALDKRLEGLVSEDFVLSSLQTLKKEISDEIKGDFDKVYEQLRSVKGKIKKAHTEIEQLKNSESDLQVEVQKVVEENGKLQKRNKELNEKINNNYDRAKYSEYQINELEQYTRRNSIRIYGTDDTDKNETPEDTEKKVLKLFKDKLEIDLQTADVDIAHRMGKFSVDGNRPVICKFIYRTHKLKVIAARKKLKGTSNVIREDLTLKNAKLLEKLSGKEEVENCWSDEGKIIALLNNDRKMRVDMYTDLSKSLLL